LKGVILDSIRDLVVDKFGEERWKEVLRRADLPVTTVFPVTGNVPDETVLKIIGSICDVFNLTSKEVAEAFGEYWVTVYMPKVYKPYYRGINTARDFLLKMDEIHRKVTENISDAHPPRFDYKWKDRNTLIMKYKSQRGLIDIFIGLINGVGKFYETPLDVNKISDNEVEITFLE